MNSIVNTLVANYGFVARGRAFFRGIGSWVNGLSVSVSFDGDMVDVITTRYTEEGEYKKSARVPFGRIWEALPIEVLK